ncbi:hypothetical protein [Streptomyces tendae]|uniref:Uncharacterized protein n=1 Tax=Streptomyces tendae TaxID=1932 RepID=A0ABX5ZVB0_STRTE|nr:hypothetical protein [Streptomyces tendae]QER88604.1 hypothetical protein F3L20_24575 [Streptomyces tendae]
MALTRDQTVIADIVIAALEGRSGDMCQLINDLPRRQHADAAAKSLDLVVHIFRSVIAPDDWQALTEEARFSRTLLDLDDQIQEN